MNIQPSDANRLSQPHDADRKSRLTTHQPIEVQSLRERAASQPPRTGDPDPSSSPVTRQFDGYGALSGVSWSQSPRFVPMSRSISLGVPQSVPARSSSFSHDPAFRSSSVYNSFRNSAFSSTFEDDESEVTSDDMSQSNYDNLADLSRMYRGRPYSPENNRSRSQSLAGLRTSARHTLGLPTPGSSGLPQSWKESHLQPFGSGGGNTHGLGVDLRPGVGRLSSYVAPSHSNYPPASSPLRGSGFQRDIADISNISPFLRDVNQIFGDDPPFREPWGTNPTLREEGWIPGSGTTSRRHSVSVVQPRRGGLGLKATDEVISTDSDPGTLHTPQLPAPSRRAIPFHDVADKLSQMNLNFAHSESSNSGPILANRPSPHFATNSQSSDSKVNKHDFYLTSREPVSPSHGHTLGSIHALPGVRLPDFEEGPSHLPPTNYLAPSNQQGSIMISNSGGGFNGNPVSPRSPTSPSSPSSYPDPYSPDFYNTQTPQSVRSTQPQHSTFSELGKGVPLHSIPPTFPLYIVEFKAGRTDLFYCSDGSPKVSVGDLVIVEADRGRDLGKVINDTITAAQLEDWQRATPKIFTDGPSSPGGSSVKKDLNPKKIYAKASNQDAQILIAKSQDEDKALQLCQAKVKQKKLPMDVIDAEYQWDRRKLTFYFVADKRIDFRELVRELFRLYKTRIWMASLSQTGGSIE